MRALPDRPARREAGRSSAVAALLALLLCAGVVAVLFYLVRPPDAEAPQPAAPDEVQVAGGPAGELPAEGEAAPVPAAESADATAAVGTEDETSVTAPAVPDEATLRIHGTVTSSSGEALDGIHVRWLRADRRAVRRAVAHDGDLLGAEPLDLTGFPAGNLRTALAESRIAMSDAEGAYELHVPRAKDAGVLVAWGTGFAAEVRRVEDGPPAAVVESSSPAEAGAPGELADIRIDITLTPGGAISGRVVDAATGDPAAGMVVAAGRQEPDTPALMNFVKPDAPSARVRADGTYRIDGLAPAEYRVVPRTGDSAYTSTRSREGERVVLEAGVEVTDVDFAVEPGGVILGRVSGPGGTPLPGAECTVMPVDILSESVGGDVEAMNTLESTKVKSDEDGAFTIGGLALGKRYTVIAHGDALAPGTAGPVELTRESPDAEVSIELGPGFSVSGRVFYTDGTPAADVEVHTALDLGDLFAGKIGPWSADNETQTDSDGAFVLEHLADGEYRLETGKRNPADFMPFQGREIDESTTVVVAGRDVTGVVLVIERPGAGRDLRLSGTVTDGLGQPLEGATVRVARTSDFVMIQARTVNTDAAGRFTVTNLEEGPFRVRAEKSGYSDAALESVDPVAGDVTLALEQHGVISGVVVASDGSAPGPGGVIKVEPVREGSAAQGLMDRIQQSVDPRRRDQGTPIADDGRFTVEAPAGKVRLGAFVPGFAPSWSESISIRPGDERRDIEIQVSVGAVLHGAVTLAGSTGGVAGATVSVRPDSGDDASNYMADLMPEFFGTSGNSAVTDAEGAWEVPHLPPGTYAVRASHDEYAPSDQRTVVLARDEVKELPALELLPGAVVAGKVTEKGKPRDGLMVQLIGAGMPMQQGTTGGDGSYEFRGVRPGQYMMNFMDLAETMKGNMVFRSRYIEVAVGEERRVDVAFGVGHRVHGEVSGLPPAPMRMITLRRPGGPPPEAVDPLDPRASMEAAKYQAGMAMIRPDGRYEIGDIEPGTYIMEIPKMPADPTNLEAYKTMERTPHYRAEVTVEEGDLKYDITIEAK